MLTAQEAAQILIQNNPENACNYLLSKGCISPQGASVGDILKHVWQIGKKDVSAFDEILGSTYYLPNSNTPEYDAKILDFVKKNKPRNGINFATKDAYVRAGGIISNSLSRETILDTPPIGFSNNGNNSIDGDNYEQKNTQTSWRSFYPYSVLSNKGVTFAVIIFIFAIFVALWISRR